MMQIIKAAFLTTLVYAGTAIAHPSHDSDEPAAPKKNAPAKAAKHSVDATVKDGVARISIMKDGSKVSTANASGVLVTEVKGARAEFPLQPGSDNVLVTREKTTLQPGTRATVSVSLADRFKVQEEVTLR